MNLLATLQAQIANIMVLAVEDTDDAGTTGGCSEAYDIMCQDLWTFVIQPIGATIAVFAVLGGIFLVVKNAMSAKPGGVAKSLVLTVLAAAFLANLEMIALIIDAGGNIAGFLVDTVTGLTSGDS